MIKTLPQIYPNETFYSFLCRVYSHSGYLFYKYFAKEAFKNFKDEVSFNYINLLSDDFKNLLEQDIGFEKLVLDHTLFKHYARFLSLDRKKYLLETAIKNNEAIYKKLPTPINNKDYFLRYCPICVKNDRDRYGECYYHVEHQIPEVHICCFHNCELIDTKLANAVEHKAGLIPLELIAKAIKEVKYDSCDINCVVARYISKVFREPLNLDVDIEYSDYLSSELDSGYFCDVGCTKKDMIKLCGRLNDYYEMLRLKNLKQDRVCDVYRGKCKNVYDLLLMAQFEDIKPEDLTNPKLDKKTIRKPIIREVINLYNEGFNVDQIANKLARNTNDVQGIINGYIKQKLKGKNRRNKIDWEAIDKDCCDKFEMATNSIKGNINKRSIATYFKLVDKSLRNLPNLRLKIKNHRILLKSKTYV